MVQGGHNESVEQKQTDSKKEFKKNQAQGKSDLQSKVSTETGGSQTSAPAPSQEVSQERRYPARVRKAPVKLNL